MKKCAYCGKPRSEDVQVDRWSDKARRWYGHAMPVCRICRRPYYDGVNAGIHVALSWRKRKA